MASSSTLLVSQTSTFIRSNAWIDEINRHGSPFTLGDDLNR